MVMDTFLLDSTSSSGWFPVFRTTLSIVHFLFPLASLTPTLCSEPWLVFLVS
ncbi:hypothetical protein GBAR_LOCUS23248 [Geodia barretti]|uniref:Uncharacterized protein n=1 Tax=Geodia barretti TaxID=519541 RepID=A0AA35T5Z5_GEOBA|nr:hypothetical protein GBAR_LOCUS23248 [Geodia barretti]